VFAENDERIVLSGTALAWSAVVFLLIGLVLSLYGPLLGHFAQHYGVTLPIAGEVLSAHFAGALAGVLISMRALERFPSRHVIGVALGLVGLGCALIALAPAWPVLLGAVVVVGLGWGSLDIGANQMVAHSEGARRSAVLNAVNALAGVGAVIGPILVAVVGKGNYFMLYAGIAVLAIVLMPQALRIPGRLPVAQIGSARRPKWLVAFFAVGFAVYVGSESGVGGWMTSHLVATGLSFSSAAALTSGFWLALGCGRVAIALLGGRVRESTIALTASGLGALALLVAAVGPSAPVAYILTGLAFAPIFPTGIVWLAKLLPGDSRATSWLFPAAMLGGAAIPAGVGIMVARFGLSAVPIVLSAVASGTFIALALAARVSSSPRAEARP
jgi:MFS transporter, FHS family, glucose/mannose:H+ symporter